MHAISIHLGHTNLDQHKFSLQTSRFRSNMHGSILDLFGSKLKWGRSKTLVMITQNATS